MALRRDYCDSIRPGEDGLLATLKEGRLHFAWMSDYRIVRDVRLYRERPGIRE